MLTRLRNFIANLWGQTTTLTLSIATALLAVPVPPELITPTIRWTLFTAALLVAALRVVAPPPKT